jgi:hypothetical protein
LNVNQQQLTITHIETKAKQALKEINAINDLSTQAISHAENAEQLVSKSQKSIDDLTRLMDFNLLILKATNDDRHAFDQLRKIPLNGGRTKPTNRYNCNISNFYTVFGA